MPDNPDMMAMSRSVARWAGVLALGLLASAVAVAQAAEPVPDTSLEIMGRLQQAAHTLDYAGVYIYQQGQVMLASRIVHVADGQDERQRVEVLDGRTRREFLRHNDEVRSLFPELRVVLVEQRQTEHFPGLFVGSVQDLGKSYSVSIEAEPGRVAGRSCQVAHVMPHDALRWRYLLCVDTESGLLLKAQTIDPEGTVLEQVAFSEVHIGDGIDPTLLEPRYDTHDWKRMRAGEPVDLAAAGWNIVAPAGFRPVSQVRRRLKHQQDVHQMVLSDGLAAMSVFIESYDPSRGETPGAVQYGATSVFSRQEDGYWLTVLGEVPAQTVQQVAQAITFELRAP